MSPPTLDWTPLDWSDMGTSATAARRWACQVLHGLAVQLDTVRRAHGLLCELLADTGSWPPGQLASRLREIDDAAVPAVEGVELSAVLSAHRLDAAAATLHRAHQRRRDAVQALRRLATLDRQGLLDPAAARVRLYQVADDLAAFGQQVADVDSDLLRELSDLTNLSN